MNFMKATTKTAKIIDFDQLSSSGKPSHEFKKLKSYTDLSTICHS